MTYWQAKYIHQELKTFTLRDFFGCRTVQDQRKTLHRLQPDSILMRLVWYPVAPKRHLTNLASIQLNCPFATVVTKHRINLPDLLFNARSWSLARQIIYQDEVDIKLDKMQPQVINWTLTQIVSNLRRGRMIDLAIRKFEQPGTFSRQNGRNSMKCLAVKPSTKQLAMRRKYWWWFIDTKRGRFWKSLMAPSLIGRTKI